MPIRKIIPTQEYSRPVKEVVSITPVEESLIQDLIDTAASENKICLSAPRIGSSKRIAVLKESSEDNYIALINPKILDGFGSALVSESCLKGSGKSKNTLRARMVLVEYQNQIGEVSERIFSDFASYGIQIELDTIDFQDEIEN